jgi:hypothetical protein
MIPLRLPNYYPLSVVPLIMEFTRIDADPVIAMISCEYCDLPVPVEDLLVHRESCRRHSKMSGPMWTGPDTAIPKEDGMFQDQADDVE